MIDSLQGSESMSERLTKPNTCFLPTQSRQQQDKAWWMACFRGTSTPRGRFRRSLIPLPAQDRKGRSPIDILLGAVMECASCVVNVGPLGTLFWQWVHDNVIESDLQKGVTTYGICNLVTNGLQGTIGGLGADTHHR